jgi:hypothetical protein
MGGKRAGCEVRECTEVEGGGLFRVSKTEGGAGVEMARNGKRGRRGSEGGFLAWV